MPFPPKESCHQRLLEGTIQGRSQNTTSQHVLQVFYAHWLIEPFSAILQLPHKFFVIRPYKVLLKVTCSSFCLLAVHAYEARPGPYNHLPVQDAILAEPIDVEELSSLGARKAICPYYASRAAQPGADLILLPYSALLSKASILTWQADLCKNSQCRQAALPVISACTFIGMTILGQGHHKLWPTSGSSGLFTPSSSIVHMTRVCRRYGGRSVNK